MGLMDLFRGKKQALPDGKFLEQDAKLKEQQAQIDEQKSRLDEQDKRLNEQDEKIHAIAAKIISVADRIKERNKCITTSLNYNPENVQDLNKNIIIRKLNNKSEYSHIVSLAFRNNEGEINEEVIIAQFNNRDKENIVPKEVQEKFKVALEYQQFLTLGVYNKKMSKIRYEELQAYCEQEEITFTPEGKEIIENDENKEKNIPKSLIYLGDENTTIKSKELGNYLTTEEVEKILETNTVLEEIIQTNNITNIDEVIKSKYSEIIEYLSEKPKLMQQYEEILVKKNKMNLVYETYEHFSQEKIEFKNSDEGKYFKLLELGKDEQAKTYYIEHEMDISKLMPAVTQGDTDSDIRKKLAIKRLVSVLHKENMDLMSEKEKKLHNRFFATIDLEDHPVYGKNTYIEDEKIFLAGILDIIKTNQVNKQEGNIERFNELIEAQNITDFGDSYIPPKRDRDEER